MMMLPKSDRREVDVLREKLAEQQRDKEAAHLDLRLSLKKLQKLLNIIGSVPIEETVDQIGDQIAGDVNE